MTGTDAVSLLLKRFPALTERVDDRSELFEMPHVAYGLLATEVLENSSDQLLLNLTQFIDELANSGDELLEELLTIDVLEGIAQDPDLVDKIMPKISPKAMESFERVEREFFKRRR